jgi:hypothetical protein
MAEQLCPVCGCAITGTGYKKKGVTYCCEPCATGNPCECSCCKVVDKPQKKTKK